MKIEANLGFDCSDNLMFYEQIEECEYPDSRFFRKNKEVHSLHCDGREQEPYTLKDAALH